MILTCQQRHSDIHVRLAPLHAMDLVHALCVLAEFGSSRLYAPAACQFIAQLLDHAGARTVTVLVFFGPRGCFVGWHVQTNSTRCLASAVLLLHADNCGALCCSCAAHTAGLCEAIYRASAIRC